MELMNTQEVADLIRVKPATLRWWRHSGSAGPPGFHISPRRFVYRRDDVEEWIEEQRNAARARKEPA